MNGFIRSLIFVLCPVLLFLAYSCNDRLESGQTDFSFGFTDGDSLVINFKGGDYVLQYNDAGMSGELKYSTDAQWLQLSDIGQGKLGLRADTNYAYQNRTGYIVIRMNDSSSRMKISQEPYVDFDIKIEQCTETSVVYSVYPTDSGMGYISLIMSKENVDSFSSENEFFVSEMDYYYMMAQYYGLSVEDYLSRLLIYGDIISQEQGFLDAGTDYYVLAYGMTAKGSRLTGLSRRPFTTSSTEELEMSFDISYQVDGPDVMVSVKPDDKSQNYVFNVIEHGLSEEDIKEVFQNFVEEQIYSVAATYGVSTAEAVDMISFSGDMSNSYSLNANTVYDGFAIAINHSGILCSDLTVKDFTTGDVEESDNIISVEVSGTGSRNAYLNVSVTNDDQYVLGVDLASNYEGMSDQEILEKLTEGGYNLSSLCRSGAFEGEIAGLSPDTEYIVFAFGYYGGVATTGIATARFRTSSSVLADVSIECIIGDYYDGTELAALDPEYAGYVGYAVIPISVKENGNVSKYYYQFSKGDYTDPSVWSDDEAVESLLEYGVSAPRIFSLPFDSDFTLFSFAVDDNGNFGPLTRKLYRFERSGVSPAEEFNPSSAESPLFLKSMEKTDSCNGLFLKTINNNNNLKF